MFKKALIILLSSFIGISSSPDFLLASDDVSVVDLDQTKVVQTIISEPEPAPAPAPVVTAVSRPTPKAAPAATPVVPANHLDISGRSLKVEYTESTAVNAGNVVKFYNNKFLYGHNSGNVFGFLSGVGVGTTFSLTYNGVTTNYRVSNKVTYEKTGSTTLGLNGATIKMGHVAAGFSPDEVKHSLSIMTCAGTPLGNGDATHRLVLFADAI